MQPLTDVTIREPKLISPTHYCVVGDVAIDASAAIAPGVVFQAPSGSRIIIGSGVCIAAGVCIQSRSGVLTISNGVSLGANVLVIGSGTIGANACVSPNSTLINPTVAAEAILPPATLIGAESAAVSKSSFNHKPQSSAPNQSFSASSYQSNGQSNGYQGNSYQTGGIQGNAYQSSSASNGASSFQSNYTPPAPQQLNTHSAVPQHDKVQNTFVEPEPVTAKPISIPDISDQSSTFVPPPLLNQPFSQPHNAGAQFGNGSDNLANGVQSGSGSSSLSTQSNGPVSGKSQVKELIAALFPSRQSLNDNSSS